MIGATGKGLQDLRRKLDENEAARLSPTACPSSAGLRRRVDQPTRTGHRQNFQVDADRILHSKAYTRYIDKTQVFYLVKNDHITHRVLHVQLVSKISRTIGRLLGLNEDLLEAIALGHDLGHPPFGHDGETYLTRVGAAHGLKPFLHAVQSVRALDSLENRGRGLNLTLQVLDGILCHDGELDLMDLSPDGERTFEELDRLITAKQADPKLHLRPMTREGCVVRLADTISYIGRDLEDAILLELVKRAEVPESVRRILGDTNGTIVFRLVEDLVSSSLDSAGAGFSPEVATALQELKDFNRARIYTNPRIKVHADKVARLYRLMFDRFLEDLTAENRKSPVFSEFLAKMDPEYVAAVPPPLAVRDYIAGMTDDYFLSMAKKMILPDRIM